MLDEAIKLMRKERHMYIIQDKNIHSYAIRKVEENKLKARLRKEVQLRDFILKILEEKKLKQWVLHFESKCDKIGKNEETKEWL